eukprot:8021003-Lingulodinium_polyedra.AAC.1
MAGAPRLASPAQAPPGTLGGQPTCRLPALRPGRNGDGAPAPMAPNGRASLALAPTRPGLDPGGPSRALGGRCAARAHLAP